MYGGKPARDARDSWSIPDGTPLERDEWETLRAGYLYPVSLRGDAEPKMVKDHPEVAGKPLDLLRMHARGKAPPLASEFRLSPEQEEKIRSIGYIK